MYFWRHPQHLSPHQGVGGFVTHGCCVVLCLLSSSPLGLRSWGQEEEAEFQWNWAGNTEVLLSYCGGDPIRLSRPRAPQSENQGPSLTGLEWKGLFWGRCPAK